MTMTRGSSTRGTMSHGEGTDNFQEHSQDPWVSLTDTSVDAMPIDMYADKDNLIVKTTIIGLKPGDVDVQVYGDTLTISAQLGDHERWGRADRRTTAGLPQPAMRWAQPTGRRRAAKQLNQARRAAHLCRWITLPFPVRGDKAEAVFQHGVLTVKLPLAVECEPRHIEVQMH